MISEDRGRSSSMSAAIDTATSEIRIVKRMYTFVYHFFAGFFDAVASESSAIAGPCIGRAAERCAGGWDQTRRRFKTSSLSLEPFDEVAERLGIFGDFDLHRFVP